MLISLPSTVRQVGSFDPLDAADSDGPVNVATAIPRWPIRLVTLAMAGELTWHHPEIVVNQAFVRANDVQRLTGSNV